MATKKSSKFPFQWPDGSWHSETWFEHQAKQQAKQSIYNYGRPGGPQSAADLPGFPGGPPVPAGAQPVAVAPPVVAQPAPFDPNAEMARLGAIRNIGVGDAEAAYQQGQLQRSTGFDAAGNPVTSGPDFNPFAQAMMLQDEYKRGQAGTLNSYAAQGQYSSGAYQRAQGRNDRLYAQGYDALRTGTQAAYHGIQSGRLQNYASNALGVSDTDFAALRRSIYGS